MSAISKIYMRVPKGTLFKPGSLVGVCAVRADYISLPNGDAIGVVHATDGGHARLVCSQHGITMLPPLHRPIKAEHIAAFGEFGAQEGHTGDEVAELLFQQFKMPWLHPETGPNYEWQPS